MHCEPSLTCRCWIPGCWVEHVGGLRSVVFSLGRAHLFGVCSVQAPSSSAVGGPKTNASRAERLRQLYCSLLNLIQRVLRGFVNVKMES
eukprot:2778265-Amphidinium_carterae.2